MPGNRRQVTLVLLLSSVVLGGAGCPPPPPPPPVFEPVPLVEILEEHYGPIIYDGDVPLPFSELSIEVFSQGAGYGCV